MQAVQTETPVSPEYVPAGQGWHTALFETVQDVDVYWPAGQVVQGVQALASSTAEKEVPDTQLAQTALAVNVHTETRYLPAVHVVQLRQAERSLAPTVFEYVPAGQDWHVALDVAPATLRSE